MLMKETEINKDGNMAKVSVQKIPENREEAIAVNTTALSASESYKEAVKRAETKK